MATFTTTLENFNTNLWGHHIPVPGHIAEQFINGDNRRVLCTLEGQMQIHAALMPSGGDYFILLNKEVRKKLSVEEGNELTVTLEKDTSEFGMPMPEEFTVMLDQDEEGAKYFRSLTMGKQRTLVHLVGKVKNPDSRITKAMAILHHLKEVKGEIDFKRMNQTMKEFNQRTKLR